MCRRTPCGLRFEEGFDVAYAVEILSPDTGERQKAFFPVRLQRAFGDVKRPADILRVDSAVLCVRIVHFLHPKRRCREGFQFCDERSPYPLVNADDIHNDEILKSESLGLAPEILSDRSVSAGAGRLPAEFLSGRQDKRKNRPFFRFSAAGRSGPPWTVHEARYGPNPGILRSVRRCPLLSGFPLTTIYPRKKNDVLAWPSKEAPVGLRSSRTMFYERSAPRSLRNTFPGRRFGNGRQKGPCGFRDTTIRPVRTYLCRYSKFIRMTTTYRLCVGAFRLPA